MGEHDLPGVVGMEHSLRNLHDMVSLSTAQQRGFQQLLNEIDDIAIGGVNRAYVAHATNRIRTSETQLKAGVDILSYVRVAFERADNVVCLGLGF